MKKLIILRHAKAVQDDSLDDIDRYIVEKGKQDIGKIGTFFNSLRIKPEIILCSDALRARQTLELFLDAAGIETKIIYKRTIYENNEGKIIELISNSGGDAETLMLVGHLPSVENIVNALSKNRIENFSTSTVAVLGFDIGSWKEIISCKGVLEVFKSPAML
jgi:phosphohistidine phosphatase